ncbi:MAG: hypothetical protein LBF86_00845 [Helicobacteraceae bacterium]|jgi:hypothetical protein|nr:hypothetical protein [Helicobacteraceae bacterium]
MKKAFIMLLLSASALAQCQIDYSVNLKAFSGNELVELRSGFPGQSSVVSRKRAVSGIVGFYNICPGFYFLAIGEGESVNVTNASYFEDYHSYTSQIVRQHGSGNVSRQSRSKL